MNIDDRSRVRDLYRHPVGRDVVDKILLQMGRSRKWVANPLVSNLHLGTLRRLSRHMLEPGFWEAAYWLLNSHPDRLEIASPEADEGFAREMASGTPPWWKEAVFYQIYPRSFRDGNGDGVGDLIGICEKLDYLQALGVDALWLSPIYDSPNDDNGYDIRDYFAIMEEMGTMEDFDMLLSELHRRGMRLIMDLVINHSSDEHAWFQAALRDPDGPYADYYYFCQGDSEQAPNNWVSFFGGSAWRRFPEQERWGLHLFSSKQMDLNWENEALRQELYRMIRFWLEKGVDGFRLDVINYISKREGLPDGDSAIGELMQFYGIEQYFFGPRLHEYLREMRREAFDPYGAFSVGETPGVGMEMGRLLTAADRHEMDLIFNFDHLEMPGQVRFDRYRYDLNYLKRYYMDYHSRLSERDWIALFWDNHDNPHMLSKVLRRPELRARLAKLLLTLQLTLKGTPFLFQGQELGRINQAFRSIDQLRDIESVNKYEALLTEGLSEPDAFGIVLAGTRDHARTVMPWDASANDGFSCKKPWIESVDTEAAWTAAGQAEQPDSVLAYTTRLLALRKRVAALRLGEIHYVEAKRKNYLGYYRLLDGETYFLEFNLSDERLPRPKLRTREALHRTRLSGRLRYMEPYEAAIYKIVSGEAEQIVL